MLFTVLFNRFPPRAVSARPTPNRVPLTAAAEAVTSTAKPLMQQ